MFDWHEPWFWILLSAVMFFASIPIAWWMILQIPSDYLTHDRNAFHAKPRHPVIHGVLIVMKNGLGLLLLIAGIIMLLTPGQGLMFIFLGIALVDAPGKKDLMRRMLASRQLYPVINKIRRRAGRPKLELPDDLADQDSTAGTNVTDSSVPDHST